jgi:hypothetical protein
MPFKSQAQRRKFAQLLVEGKISNETYEEWNRDTGGRNGRLLALVRLTNVGADGVERADPHGLRVRRVK